MTERDATNPVRRSGWSHDPATTAVWSRALTRAEPLLVEAESPRGAASNPRYRGRTVRFHLPQVVEEDRTRVTYPR
jgi:hypothetical protein